MLLFHGKKCLQPALMLFILFPYPHTLLTRTGYNFVQYNIPLINMMCNMPDFDDMSHDQIVLYTFISLFMLCGDIHPNPGPSKYVKSQNILSIVHCNVRSLQNKLIDLEAELKTYDIITLSETWLNTNFPADNTILNGYYPPVRKDRENGAAGGGVAIYVKDNLICKHRPDLSLTNLEAVWIETKLNQETILIGSFYRPPNANVAYWDLIDNSIKLAMNTPHKIVILGDFNADCKYTIPGHLLRVMHLNSLHQVVTEPTRYTENSSTLLDLILTQNPDIIEKVGVLPPVCSDHCCPFIEIANNMTKGFKFKRILYNYSKLDEEKYLNELSSVDWNDIISTGQVDKAAELFTEKLTAAAKRCMPIKAVTEHDNDQPWITNEIKKLICKKNSVHNRAKQLNSEWCWKWFRNCRNDLTAKIRLRKNEYLQNIENQINSDESLGTKCWWKLVNRFAMKKGLG